jgi:hypothetical protein
MKSGSALWLATVLGLAALATPNISHAGCPPNRTVIVCPTRCPQPVVRTVFRPAPRPVMTQPGIITRPGMMTRPGTMPRPGCNQAPVAYIPANAVGGGAGNLRAINSALRQHGYTLQHVGGNLEARALPGTRR